MAVLVIAGNSSDPEYPHGSRRHPDHDRGQPVEDPELRFTPAGQPVAQFRVASTPRFRDNATGEWKDGDTLFLTCNVWRQAAENVAESLTRGMRVIVSGPAAGSGRMRPRRARSGPCTRSRSMTSAPRCGTPRPRSTGWPAPAATAATAAVSGGSAAARAAARAAAGRRPGRPGRRGGRPVGAATAAGRRHSDEPPSRRRRRSDRPVIRTTPSPPEAGLCKGAP